MVPRHMTHSLIFISSLRLRASCCAANKAIDQYQHSKHTHTHKLTHTHTHHATHTPTQTTTTTQPQHPHTHPPPTHTHTHTHSPTHFRNKYLLHPSRHPPCPRYPPFCACVCDPESSIGRSPPTHTPPC